MSDEGNGHAYFRSSPSVSSDILMTLMYDLDPSERGLERVEGLPTWEFPLDYRERLLKALNGRVPFGNALVPLPDDD